MYVRTCVVSAAHGPIELRAKFKSLSNCRFWRKLEMEVVKHLFFEQVHKKIDQVRKVYKRAKQSRRQRAFKRQQAKERTMFMFLLCSTFLHISMPTRTVWENERSSQWWERIVNQTFTANDWQTNFRLSKSMFLYLCNELRLEIEKKDTDMRPAISVEKRIAKTLWFMATNADFRTIDHLFGVSKASICNIRKDVCTAMVKVLMSKYIQLPSGSGLATVMGGFARKGFPQCAGAVDGTHIPIEAPQEFPADYHNRKGQYCYRVS